MKFHAIAVTGSEVNTDTAETTIVANNIEDAMRQLSDHAMRGRLSLPVETADTLILAICTHELAYQFTGKLSD